MADIELVVKIPEAAYNLLQNDGVDWLGAEHILDRVAKGTPLPKGHGKLIDADKIGLSDFEIVMCEGNYKEALLMLISKIEGAQAIIEAYNLLQNDGVDWLGAEHILDRVAKGTPLPKGHGRLIILSEDAVKREQMPLSFSNQNWISEVGLSIATVAIIEADKAESDE